MAEEDFVYTACPGWGDHEFCALKTIVKDGEIVRTEKIDYTGPEANEGYICQKGIMSCRQPYSPDRLLYPLKRAGKRGEGKWERVSWDQALDEIAEKMLSIRDEYGPEALVVWNLPAGVPPSLGLGGLLATRFISLWGATDPIYAVGLDNGPMYAEHYLFDNDMMMLCDPSAFDHTNMIIVWGANPIENQLRIANHLVEAQANGAYIVDIGLVFDGTAGKADWFIPVKPGTDAALSMAMANYIIQHGYTDVDWMTEYTCATYLIGEDGDYLRDPENNYLVWDLETGTALPCSPQGPMTWYGADPPKGEIPTKNPALTGEYEVDGVKCKPAFQLLVEHCEKYTLEYAEHITGVPKEDIVKLTEMYAHSKPAFILGALGLRYMNQGDTYGTFYILGALTGNITETYGGVTSELMTSSWPLMFNDYEICRPLGDEGNKMHAMRQCDFIEQCRSGKPFQFKGLFVNAGNPVHNMPNRGFWTDLLDQMELVVDVDIWMTDTGELADYVLPDCMPFEREELIVSAAYNHVVLQEPAIEPRGEAKEPNWLWTQIAKRVGLGEYFDKTTDEWLAMRVNDSQFPLLAYLDPPLTWERLKKEKMIRSMAPEGVVDTTNNYNLNNESGRMEFYNPKLRHLGRAIPGYLEPVEVPTVDSPNEKYPYQFFSGRQRFFMQSMFTDDPVMKQLSGGNPQARMNPLDARREGIEDGDMVEVYNDRGHVVVPMRLDEAIPPGTVHVWFGWRKRHFEDGTYAELLRVTGAKENNDATSDFWYQDVLSKFPLESQHVGKGSSWSAVGAWDTLWDCACAVRKLGEEEGD
ncbi:MAG: molybdopterin-containing oxidoreductase family protein [Coriobacteriales bacterium]|jgi:anaerobic selenocysteine-containing dehydrogenase